MRTAHINRIATAVPSHDVHRPFIDLAGSMITSDARLCPKTGAACVLLPASANKTSSSEALHPAGYAWERKAAMSAASRNVDHLVIGGGPAGAMAAIKLAEAGRQVTLVESPRAFPIPHSFTVIMHSSATVPRRSNRRRPRRAAKAALEPMPFTLRLPRA
jgi:FAD binding domain